MAFETAAKAAYRQTMPKAGPQLLEPIMKVDVFVPEATSATSSATSTAAAA